MVHFRSWLQLLAATLAASAHTPAGKHVPSILPGAYIVEYEDNHDPAGFLHKIDVEPQAAIRREMNFELFKGASFQVHDLSKAEHIAAEVAQMPAVKRVWPVRLYKIPDYTVHWSGNPGEGVTREDMKRVKRDVEASDTFSPHLMTQVNKLRDAGNIGTGIKVAIVDTGTDYLHPALGGCFGAGCLVSYGYDVVGDKYNGTNEPHPDPDPMDNCNGHGSHVAGIIAAQSNNPFGIIGAAQGVTLGSYRVFGCDGQAGNDVLISAYNMAYEAGSDLITASIGGPSGWNEDPWAVVVSRIVDKGVPCTVSAGNEGDQGLFYSSTAAGGRRVTAIASVDNTLSPTLLVNATYTAGGNTTQSFGFTAGTPEAWSNVTLPLWAGQFNTSEKADGCEPYPANTPDLSGYIVLVRRGTCTFVRKVQNAIDKGAQYVIFYNNVVGATTADASAVSGVKAVAMVTADQGVAWINQLKAGVKVVVSMDDPLRSAKFLLTYPNTATPGFISTYSSWGPSNEVEVKPQFSAPGGMILSTYPRALGAYAVLSGTSMACPITAAVYALIMKARGTKNPAEIENLLSATAKPNLFNNGEQTAGWLAPVPQQGAGLIQAYDAAYATALLNVSSLSFNDTDNFVPKKRFTLTNTGNKTVTYQLGHVGAVTGYTFANDTTIYPDTFPNELVAQFATIRFACSGNFTLAPGKRRTVTVVATPPVGLDAKRLPVYSGYITVNGTDGSALSLPYLGVVGSMHSTTVMDTKASLLSHSFDDDNGPVAANTLFTLPPIGHANDTIYYNQTDLPKVVITLTMGSALVRCDVEPLGGNGTSNATMVFGTKSIGQIGGFPVEYSPRGIQTATWSGELADGSYAPEGMYQFHLRALRIFGDPVLATEYDSVTTVPFAIRYEAGLKRRFFGGAVGSGSGSRRRS